MYQAVIEWGPTFSCGYVLALCAMAIWMRVDVADDPEERDIGGEGGGA